MSDPGKNEGHNYDEPELKRQKIDNDRGMPAVVHVDDGHVNIETSLLSNHSNSPNNDGRSNDNNRMEDRDREAQLLDRVASGIIESVANRNSLNNNNNGGDIGRSFKQNGEDTYTVETIGKANLDNSNKELLGSGNRNNETHIEEEEEEGERASSRNVHQQQHIEQVQTPQDYSALIDRHTIHNNSDDSIPVELQDLGDSHHIHSIATDDSELNGTRILNKRGRKTTALVGSEAWRQQRKFLHKEVERRRRENINMAINTLGVLLPVKETSKAAILNRSVEYIQKLKETENSNIEKWTLQKLLSEQNASQLTAANEKLQEELANAYKEIRFLKNLLKKHNISYESDEDTTVQ